MYHHANATQRLRRNYIRLLRVEQQDVVSHAGKTEALTNYFRSIIGVAGNLAPADLDRIYMGRQPPSSALVSPFTEAETKLAILSMNSSSAPGPDGFGPAFYRAAWSSVKPQIMQFMDAFYRGKTDLERLNRSHMVLIPKKPAAVEVDCFRPICLHNCSLKILSKVLTTRLRFPT